MSDRSIQVVATAAAVAEAAAQRIVAAAQSAIAARGAFSLVLSGGSTPKALYELLTTDEYFDRIDWKGVEVYFGDERCVPPASKDSNYRMARQALLDHVPITSDRVHRIRGEIEPEQAATEYERLLRDKFGDGGPDLALLGMGDDGHTASLFPETPALNETSRWCLAHFVPKLNAWRVTMTAAFLNRSAEVMVLVCGAAKAQRLAEVLEGPRQAQRLPIQLIDPAGGRVVWLLDAAAAGMDDVQ